VREAFPKPEEPMFRTIPGVLGICLVLAVLLLGPSAWAKPDLVVTDIVLDPAVPHIQQGKLTATIKNLGDSTSFFVNINLIMYLDGKQCDTGWIIAGLGAGKTATEETTACNPDTPGPHVIRFVVDTDNDVDESNESNNALEKTFTWAGGPDLVVTSIVLDPASPTVTEGKVIATIKNQGEDPTQTFVNIDVTFYLDGKECDTGILIGGLGAGKTATEESTKCGATTPGPHVIKVVVDTTKEVVESDESNNAMEKTFTWTGGPDLVITGLTIDPAVPEIGTGMIRATVKNQGNVGTGLFVNINLRMYLDGKECDTGWITGGLGAGSTATEDTTACNPATPGKHVVRFVVDTDNDVIEADESNNSFEKEFTWTSADLVITDLSIDPALPEFGKGTIRATVKNQGAYGTGLFVNINLKMYLDGKECDTGWITGGLGAGATATEDTTACNPDKPGKHVVRFEVDTDDDVVETDEGNNTFEKEFTWSAPDLVVTKVVADPAQPQPGQKVKLTATVKNQGPIDAHCNLFDAINVGFYLDGETKPCDTGLILCGLGAGKEATEESSKCTPSSAGPHTLKVTIDIDQDVVETDETNNSLEQILMVCAPAEACNGLDDDCDGGTDETFEDLGIACDGPDADACKDGVKVCAADGKGTTCQEDGPGKVEACNGQDEDCDGQTDEDWPALGKPCTPTEGTCKAGTTVCSADGKGTECKPGAPGTADFCNGIDDDCDGQTDEDVPGVGTPCFEGVGGCREFGTLSCDPASGLVCSAKAGTPAGEETCGNDQDDDCDGLTDEGCDCEPGTFLPCGTPVGECDTGVMPCGSDLRYVAQCQKSTGPATEACDDKDNDCDGSTDEDCPCTEGQTRACDATAGVCSTGKQECSGGKWTRCIAPQAKAEVCGDSRDDDCDGRADDGCPCSSVEAIACPEAPDDCAEYERLCLAGGVWSPCQPRPGTRDPKCQPVPDTVPDSAPDAGGDTGGHPDVPAHPDVSETGTDPGIADPGAGGDSAQTDPGVVVVKDSGVDVGTKGVPGSGGGCSGGAAGSAGAWILGLLSMAALRWRRARQGP
jgi:subtilase family serine protease